MGINTMDNETQNSLPDELDELELGSVDSNSSSNTEDSVSIVMKPQPSKIVVEDNEDDEDKYDPCYTKDELEAINKFYQLKGKYDEIIRRKKQKIINNDIL